MRKLIILLNTMKSKITSSTLISLPSLVILTCEEFLDWIVAIKNSFKYTEIKEEKKAKPVAYKLKGGAST